MEGERATLFIAWRGTSGRLVAWDGTAHRTLLPDVERSFRLFGTGHVLFWRRAGSNQADLCAAPLDPTRVEISGEPVALLSEAVAQVWDLSNGGTLVYREIGGVGGARGVQYSWLARGERPAPPTFGPLRGADVPSFRVSPDGRRVLYFLALGGGDGRLVVADLAARTTGTVAAGPGVGGGWFVWMPDGRRAIYQVGPTAPSGAGLLWKPVDGSAPAERLTSSKVWQHPQFVTRDGRSLVYQESGGLGTQTPLEQAYDLWLLPLDPPGQPRPLLRTKANERLAHLSPDQKWMAYVSDEMAGAK